MGYMGKLTNVRLIMLVSVCLLLKLLFRTVSCKRSRLLRYGLDTCSSKPPCICPMYLSMYLLKRSLCCLLLYLEDISRYHFFLLRMMFFKNSIPYSIYLTLCYLLFMIHAFQYTVIACILGSFLLSFLYLSESFQ
uniref:Uncharacterized protein n=1 Tax=Cacopsylla melanoneura TaxID=428564 RepID=A0A8D9BRZ3_9HEMI